MQALTPNAPGIEDGYARKAILMDLFEGLVINQQDDDVGIVEGVVEAGQGDTIKAVQFRRQGVDMGFDRNNRVAALA